ncbi:MAG: pro-sigmaK processing inhibitor BofA family protein [Clostridiaceae bacterium]|nr:pro-sigmaK processing inhibitor BofA family protein [Clostridiaceae bacterium]
MDNAIWFILAIVGLYLVVKFFKWPFKILLKLIVNGVLGVILLLLVNFVGTSFGISVGINFITALIAGFFGVPGVIFLIIFSLI